MNRIVRIAALAALAASLLPLVGCGKKKDREPLPVLPAAQMYEDARRLLAQRKLNQAERVLQQIDLRYTTEGRKDLEPLVRLLVADTAFYQDSIIALIEARTLYLEFVTLFPDHEKAPYAQFQAGMCSLKQAGHPSKDQSQTIRAIGDFSEVRRRYPDSRFAAAAAGKIAEAEAILGEHEYLVGRFYMKRKAWTAAQERFSYLLERYPDYDEMDKVYLAMASVLTEVGNDVEAALYVERLISDYPQSGYRKEAEALAREHDLELSVAATASNR